MSRSASRTSGPCVRTCLLVVWTAVAGLVAGCGEAEPSPAVVRGQQHYFQLCQLCHGEHGEGQLAPRAPALSNPAFLASASDELLRSALTRGRPGTSMSAFGAEGGPLDAAACDEVVAFLRSWMHGAPASLDDTPPAANTTRGARLYGQLCSACHGPRGEGAAFQSLSNPEFLSTVMPGFLRYAIRGGRQGTHMPAFPDVDQGAGVEELVALILSWRAP